MEWKNEITRLLQIPYPLVQAPMFGVTTPEMVASATQADVLGSLPLGDLPPGKCAELIWKTKNLTNRPFEVNLFVHQIPEITNELRAQYAQAKDFIEHLAKQHNLECTLPAIDDYKLPRYQELIDVIISEKCKILSFTFGNLDSNSIDRLKSEGTILIGTCTSTEEAKALENSGIDIICVQGIEAGGHRGSFSDKDLPEIGGFSLLPQVYETVQVPLLYAGGIYNARTLMAAKILGAQGFQVGSLLLGSTESALNQAEKKRLRSATEKEIVLTNTFSGKYARGIKNELIKTLENSPYVLPYPYQNKLTGELRRIAKLNNNTEFLSIWTGQARLTYPEIPTSEILKKLIKEVEDFRTEN